jgi:hypothetical protein
MRRKLLSSSAAGILGVWALTGCMSAAPDDAIAAVTQASTPSNFETVLKEGSEWAGMFTNYAGVVSLLASLLSDSPEQQLHDDLTTLYNALIDTQELISALGGEILSAEMGNNVSDVGAEALAARRDLTTYGVVPPANAALYLNDSLLAIHRLSTNEGYWKRLFVDAATAGEWRSITSFRPPVAGSLVWDYRWALPALMAAVPMRLDTLAAADPVQFASGTYAGEIEGYRDRVMTTMQTIESNIACGYQVEGYVFKAPFDHVGSAGYTVHVICGDPFTGQEVTATRYRADTAPAQIPFVDNPIVRADFSIFDPDSKLVLPALLSVGDLRNRFWNQVADDAFLQNWLSDTLREAQAELRRNLGLFQMRRMVDSLYAVAHHTPSPISGGRLRSGLPGLCLANTLSLSGGINWATTATCDPPLAHTYGQTWTYQPMLAQLRSTDAGQCLAIVGQADLVTSILAVAPCDPSDERQAWSYDPETRRIRNAQTYVVDVSDGRTTPGGSVWTYWDTGNIAQQWGFPSPYTTHGGPPGPF